MTPMAAKPAPGLLLADLTEEEARSLDQDVNRHIETHGRQTVELYVALGRCLARLHAGRGYKALGFDHWRSYLATKPDFGLTYLSYILKVGEAAELGKLDLSGYAGISGSMLLLYAQMTDFPDKIGTLMAATWDQIKACTVRDADKALRAAVDADWGTYKRSPKPPHSTPSGKGWQSIWESDFRGLDASGQADYIKEMWAFLEHHDHGVTPPPAQP